MLKYYRKNECLQTCGPQIRLCLFKFLPIASKQLNISSQMSLWCRGNVSALDARGPGFNSRLRQGLICYIFYFVVVFLPFAMLNYLVYLTYCKICDRLLV